MRFDVYPWLLPGWRVLMRYWEQQRMPSALLLSSTTEMGQRVLIDRFAQAIYCTNRGAKPFACGTCPACLLFDSGNYPDYLVLRPEEGDSQIKIDAIRALCHRLALNAQFEQHRFAVIEQADLMNRSAANSLLKTLEEPSRDTTIVLLTERSLSLPATIRSRCQQVKISPDPRQLETWLSEQGCEDPTLFLSMANGSPIRAVTMWQNKALVARDKLFQSFVALLSGKAEPIMVSEQFQDYYPSPILDLLATWVMNLIRIKSTGNAPSVPNSDRLHDLQDVHIRLDFEHLFGLLSMIQKAKQRMHSQLNKQLVVEEIMVTCWQMGQAARQTNEAET